MRHRGQMTKFFSCFLSFFYPQLSTIISVDIVDNYVYNLKSEFLRDILYGF